MMRASRDMIGQRNDRRNRLPLRFASRMILAFVCAGCAPVLETTGGDCTGPDGRMPCSEPDGGAGGMGGGAGAGGSGCGNTTGAAGAGGSCIAPTAEDCTTREDENCDGVLQCSGTPTDLRGFGDEGVQISMDITVDQQNNAVLVGFFGGVLDFGDGPIVSHELDDAFIAKFDSAGTCLWSRAFGDDEVQSIQRVAVDPQGNIVVVGHFRGMIDLGGGPLVSAGARDVFVAKLDPSGGHIWSKRFGGLQDQLGRGIATDSAGNVFVAGSFWGSVDFDGNSRTSAGWEDIFVVKLDENGNQSWVRTFGDAETQETWDLAADKEGNVVLTGFALGNVDFGDGMHAGAGMPDAIVVKLDGNGNTMWSRRYGDAGMQLGQSVAVDGEGNVIVTGEVHGSIDFGDGPVHSFGAHDLFVVKLDPGGTLMWHRRYGDAEDQASIIGAVDNAGAVLLTGSFQGSVEFGGLALVSAGADDAFMTKLDRDGNAIWSHGMGDFQTQAGTGVAADGLGRVVMTGKVWGTIDLGGGLLASGGSVTSNVFIARFEP